MKRFLSILLASMMILGCMAVTVSADVAIALETGDTLTALATNPTVAAGRKIMVNKIEGATYYRNGEEIPAADVVDGPKAGTVALPVIEGGNVFQAKVGGTLSSEYVYVKGTAYTENTGDRLDPLTSVSDASNPNTKFLASADSGVSSNTSITENGTRTGIYYSNYAYRRTNIRELTSFSDDQGDAAIVENDCYVTSFTSNTKGDFALVVGARFYNTSNADVYSFPGVQVTSDGSLYITINDTVGNYQRNNVLGSTSYDTGVNTTTGEWHKYTAMVYASTMKQDIYYDNVLIAKDMDLITSAVSSLRGVQASSQGVCAKSSATTANFYFDEPVVNNKLEVREVSAEPTQPSTPGGSDPVVPVLVSGSIAEGITINRAALADSTDVIAVVAVTAAGVPTVQLSTESTVENTFTVTGAAKVFVWDWDTLAPLCAPIQ